MCDFSFILGMLTLDNLYPMDKTKGRINWLIFIICKVMAPALLVMVTDDDEIRTYGNSMMEYYKKSLRIPCADLRFVEMLNLDSEIKQYELSPDLTLNQLLNELESKERSGKARDSRMQVDIQDLLYTNMEYRRGTERRKTKTQQEADKSLSATLKSYLMFLQSANMSSPMEGGGKKELQDIKFCCDHYRKIARETVSCMRKQRSQNASDILPFGIAMFCPCFGAILVAFLLVPLKHVSWIRNKFLKHNGPVLSNLQMTPEEKLSNIKDCLHFIVDLAMFYLVIHKIQATGAVIMGQCVQNNLCLAKYTSLQMLYLMAMAQTPWISILWNFVY